MARTGHAWEGLTVRADAAGAAAVRAALSAFRAGVAWQDNRHDKDLLWFFARDLITPHWFARELACRMAMPVVRSSISAGTGTARGVLDQLRYSFHQAGVDLDESAYWFAAVLEDDRGDAAWLGVRALCSAQIERRWGDGDRDVNDAESEGLRLASGGAFRSDTGVRLAPLALQALPPPSPCAAAPITWHPVWLPDRNRRRVSDGFSLAEHSAELCSALCRLETLRTIEHGFNRDPVGAIQAASVAASERRSVTMADLLAGCSARARPARRVGFTAG